MKSVVTVKKKDIDIPYWIKETAREIAGLAMYATPEELNALQGIALKMKESARVLEEKEDKYARMQYLLQKMIQDAVEKSNEKLLDNLSVNLRGDMCKELDYQFRLLEERENARDEETRKVQEEHYKHVDELLTQYRGKKNGRKEDSKVKKEFRLWRKAEAK